MPVPGDDLLLSLVRLLDEASPWGSHPVLVRIENGDADGFDLGLRPLDGHHPEYWLLGFTAPSTWECLGLVAEGWAGPPDQFEDNLDLRRNVYRLFRPSEHPRRRRARAITLVTRGGHEVSAVHVQGDAVITNPGPVVGRVAEMMRRAMGLPSGAPP